LGRRQAQLGNLLKTKVEARRKSSNQNQKTMNVVSKLAPRGVVEPKGKCSNQNQEALHGVSKLALRGGVVELGGSEPPAS